ncbi:MAG: NAD(P)/FAD-dependent oxidoreductase [Gemmatimonadales bacterium]
MTGIADVLIAGAGPAGASAAIRLARAGLRVLVVDRATFPRDKACAEYLSPETLRHLDALGVLGALDLVGGTALTGTSVTGPHGSRLTGLFALAGHHPFRQTGLSLPRLVLDQALVSAARGAGAEVREGTTVTDLVYQGGAVAGAVVRCGSETRVMRSRLVIGADGLRSVIARRLGHRTHGRPRRMAMVAHVAGVRALADTAEMHVGRQGYVGLNPLGDGLANVAIVLPTATMASAVGRPEAFFFEALARFPEVAARVPGDGVVRRVMVTGPFAARSHRITVDGAMLVGDAAEFFDPFTGEGICAALQGGERAAVTAREALEGAGVATAARLAAYRSRRRQAFAGKWAVERMIGWAMHAPALFDRAVERLERRGLSHTLIGVTGNFVPAREVLNPRFLASMVF